MKYWIGIDGGGTKTAFALSAADGIPIQTLATTGCSYQVLGVEAVVKIRHVYFPRRVWSGAIVQAAVSGCLVTEKIPK